MSMPFYVAPEQLMKDKADFARKNIGRGRPLVGIEYADGILICGGNPSTTLHKISEIYDRIAFAGVGKYSEFDSLRRQGVQFADVRGYQYSREDVDARSLANAYAQVMNQIFTHELKPLEVEILVAEVGYESGEDRLFHISYDGTAIDDDDFSVLGGEADPISERLRATYEPGRSLVDTARVAFAALAGPDRTLSGSELEVAVLGRDNGRRAFRRILGDELEAMLA